MDNQFQDLTGRESSNSFSFVGTLDTIENGDFEIQDFSNWRTIGDTDIVSDDVIFYSEPPLPFNQALITSGFSDGGGSVIDTDLEEFLDLVPGTLDGLTENDAIEGSVIKQTFTAQAGDIVSFDWNFLTNESTPNATYNDTAFLSVNGFTFELADTNSHFVDASADNYYHGSAELTDEFTGQTGTQTLTFSVAEAGTYTIGFGVVDVGDDLFDSGLLIDNVEIQPLEHYGFAEHGFTGGSGIADSSINSDVNLVFGDGGFETIGSNSMETDLVLGNNGFEVI